MLLLCPGTEIVQLWWNDPKAQVTYTTTYASLQERFTCTRLKANPAGGEVLAQTNGDYIALFSTVRPYKMNKCKRFESHKVSNNQFDLDHHFKSNIKSHFHPVRPNTI